MATKNLGKIAFLYRGDYFSGTTYQKNDVVFDGESSYISFVNNNTGNSLTNINYWKYLSRGNYLTEQQNADNIAQLETDLNTAQQGMVAQLNDVAERIDNLVTTPVPVGEVIAEEIIDARGGEVSVGAKIRSVDAQLEENTTDLEQRSLNIYKLGVVPNDDTKATENTILLNQLLLDNTVAYLAPGGTISVNDTLFFADGAQLLGENRTFLKMLADKDVVSLKSRSRFERIKLTLPLGHTKSGILLDGANKIGQPVVRDVRIDGKGRTSTGVKLTGIGLNNYVIFGIFDNVHCTNCLYDIYLEDNQGNSADKGFVNGNRFTNLILTGNNGIFIKGRCAGNQFDFQYQSTASTVRAIYCEGNNNIFDGFVFDIAYVPNAKNFELTSSSYQNLINLPQVNTSTPYYINAGLNNIIANKLDSGLKPINTGVGYEIVGETRISQNSSFFGMQDNCLSGIDKLGVVAITGDRIDAGSNSIIFSPKNLNNAIFADPSITPIVIEVDISTKPIAVMNMLAINFNGGGIAENYKIETVKTLGGAYGVEQNVVGNTKSTIMHPIPRSGSVFKFKITITKAIYHSVHNADKKIIIENIYGASSVYYDSPFMYKEGDTMRGHLSFEPSFGIKMISPNGTNYLLRINDDGTLRVT